MKRFLALLGAVALVSAALWIRSRIDDPGSGDAAGPGRSSVTTSGHVACITELRDACAALGPDVRVEDAAVTATSIANGKADLDAWVTLAPWPAITRQLAGNEDVVADGSSVVSSPLQIVAWRNPASANCDPPAWRCLADHAAATNAAGRFPVGIPPLTTATGVLLLGNASAGYVGRSDFFTNDLDDGYLPWKTRLLAQQSSTPLADALRFGPGRFAAVGATGADVRTLVDTFARKDQLVVATPDPPATAVVVVAPLRDRRPKVDTGRLRSALISAGWSADAVPPATGLPDPGVLLALSGLRR